jgi:hypothetical protein
MQEGAHGHRDTVGYAGPRLQGPGRRRTQARHPKDAGSTRRMISSDVLPD